MPSAIPPISSLPTGAVRWAQLTGLFYELKNETRDRLGDDALIAAMAARFNGEAGGSPEALADTEPAWFLQFAAEGGRP